jgi:hypothetical protein
MIKPKKRKSEVSRSVSVEAEHVAIPSTRYKGLVAYRVTYTEKVVTRRNGRTYEKDGAVWSKGGVCMKGELDKVLSGKTQSLPEHATVKRDGWHSSIIAVKPEYLETARKVGWYIDDGSPYDGLDVKDPISALERGEDVRFIESHGAGHQLFDLNDNPLPVALEFNYIDGGMSEDRFDLEKVVRILLEREDVILAERGGERFYGEWRGKPDDPARYIGGIPHYNRDRGRSQCVSFRWHPTEDDYATAFAIARDKRKDQSPTTGDIRWAALFDADVFGLVSGGASHFKVFTKTLRDHNPDGSRRRQIHDYEDYEDDCY